MKFECRYNKDSDTIETVTSGIVSYDDMIDMINNIIEYCQEYKTANLLIDHSKLDPTPASSIQIKQFAVILKKF